MKAVQAFPDGLRVHDVPTPEPGPGEVLVKVAGAGLCHSDCMISKYPVGFGRSDGMTIGHETAGWRVDTGQPVIVHAEFGCGVCEWCRRGGERFCPKIAPSRGAGQGHDGGMAEYIKAPARALVALPDSLDPVDAGPLDDAALTPYHAIRTSMPWLEPGNVVAVIGIGGLGHMALQILRAMTSATIVAVEKDERKRAFAGELGADVVLDSGTMRPRKSSRWGWKAPRWCSISSATTRPWRWRREALPGSGRSCASGRRWAPIRSR